MTALMAGATGLIGRELARHWTGPGNAVLLLRRVANAVNGLSGLSGPSGPSGPRLSPLLVDYAALPALPNADWAFCCLGTTMAQAGSQAAFRAVDHDAVLDFARAAHAAGVKRFAMVSALGANADAGSFYSRTKGQAEKAVAAVGFDSLVIARPSLLAGDRSALGQPMRRGEHLALRVSLLAGQLIPLAWRPIEAAVVARALLRAVHEGQPGLRVLSSAQLQALGSP